MKWRVGFLPADPREPLWWHRFIKPGYAHCWAARRLGRNMWVWVEWCPAQVVAGIVPTEFVRSCSLGAHEVLVFHQPPSLKKHFWIPPMPFHHCAGLVAHLLGLRIWAMTPWRLACELRRRRGYPLVRPEG